MCCNEKSKCCEQPEKLEDRPKECTPERIAECHPDSEDHPCVTGRETEEEES